MKEDFESMNNVSPILRSLLIQHISLLFFPECKSVFRDYHILKVVPEFLQEGTFRTPGTPSK